MLRTIASILFVVAGAALSFWMEPIWELGSVAWFLLCIGCGGLGALLIGFDWWHALRSRRRIDDPPEILAIFDQDLREEEISRKPVLLMNRGPTDAFDVSVVCTGYDDYNIEFTDPIPRLLQDDSIELKPAITRGTAILPLTGIVRVLRVKANDAGFLNRTVSLRMSVRYKDSKDKAFKTEHKIKFHLWRQKVWTEYVGLTRLKG